MMSTFEFAYILQRAFAKQGCGRLLGLLGASGRLLGASWGALGTHYETGAERGSASGYEARGPGDLTSRSGAPGP